MSALLFLALFFLTSGLAALPNGWKACKKSSPDYNDCLAKAMQAAVNSLIEGDRKLGVLPLDPLTVEKLVFPKHGGAVNLELVLRDVILRGLKDITIKSFETNWKTATVMAHIPRMEISAMYEADGKILVLPITGNGACNITFEDVEIDSHYTFERGPIDGKEHLLVKELLVDLLPKKVFLHFDNLFNGDKVLGETTNKFVNENWADVYKELRPSLQQGMSLVCSSIANNVFSKIPASEIILT